MRFRLTVLGVLVILSLLIGIGYWQPTSTARADRRQQSTPETITVTGFTPAQVMVGHSDLLTISGTGFTATLTVEINGATVASVQFVDATTLQVTVPTSLTAGQYPVAVRDSVLGAVSAPSMLVIQNEPTATPTLTPTPTPSLTPVPGLIVTQSEPGQIVSGQEAQLSVFGANFTDTTAVRLVGFGLLQTRFVNSGALAATLPALIPPGVYGVEVSDVGRGAVRSPNVLIVIGPTMTPGPSAIPPTLWPTAEPSTPLPGQPSLVVRNFVSSPSTIAPGDSVTLTFEVVNQGNRSALGVSVSVDSGSKFIPANGQASALLPDIGPGGLSRVQLAVVSAEDVAVGPSLIPLTLSYRDFSGQAYTSKTSLAVTIGVSEEAPQVIFSNYTVQPSPAQPGQTITVTGRVTNTGNEVAAQVLLRIGGTTNVLLPSSDGDSVPLGDLQPGDFKDIQIQLVVVNDAKTGPQAQPYTLTYLQDDASKEVTGNLTVEIARAVTRDPLILLTSYETGSEALNPGQTFTLAVTLQNVGEDDAHDMLVTFGTVEGGSQGSQSGTPEASTTTSGSTFAPLGAGGTIYVGEMVQEQEVNLDQEFIVTGSATSGIYNLPITLRYQKTDGTPVQNSLSASIVIIAPPVLQISLRSPVPESVNVGEPFSLEVVIANNGKNTFNVTRITVEAENGELLDGQETLPKPIKTTENTSVMPMIMAMEEGKVEVTLTIYYLDDFNREATVVQTYETEAMAPPPPEEFPDMMPEVTPTPEPEDDGTIGKVLLGLLGLGS